MRVYILVDKNGEVLRHSMAEVRAEYADIEAAPVADAYDSLRLQLVRDADTRPECGKIVSYVAVLSVRAETAHSDGPVPIDVSKTSVALGVHGFWEIVLPPDAVSDRQFAAHAELVLGIEEKALLTFGSSLANAGEALEVGNITQQERGYIQAALLVENWFSCGRIDASEPIRRLVVVEGELPGSIGVAREAEVMREAKVCAKLHSVIATNLGPVVHELILVLVFDQRAVAS